MEPRDARLDSLVKEASVLLVFARTNAEPSKLLNFDNYSSECPFIVLHTSDQTRSVARQQRLGSYCTYGLSHAHFPTDSLVAET